MLRIGSDKEVSSLETVSMSEKGFREDDLREWIINDPRAILGEQFLLIGREVSVKNIGDGIDLLGIDRDGNVVVIELKRGSLKGTVDFQGLKYAAYTSHWDYDKLRDQFEKFRRTSWGRNIYDDETTFTEVLDEFCNEDYTFNQDQRIVLVGESVRDRLDIVLRWLSDRTIDVTVVEFQLFTDDDRLYLDAEQTIPVPERTVTDVSPDTSEQPWKDDGRDWHLHERTNTEAGDLLEKVVEALGDIEFLDGPEWGQKHYLSFKRDRKRRIALRTKRTLFHVDIYDVDLDVVDIDRIVSGLGIVEGDVKADKDLRGGRSGVRITCRPGGDINLDALTEHARELVASDEP
ncbi:hypothetical protein ACLI4Q_10940 [Natrialbaceae archaeon A-CW1-1]